MPVECAGYVLLRPGIFQLQLPKGAHGGDEQRPDNGGVEDDAGGEASGDHLDEGVILRRYQFHEQVRITNTEAESVQGAIWNRGPVVASTAAERRQAP